MCYVLYIKYIRYIYAVCEKDGLVESSFHKITPLIGRENEIFSRHLTASTQSLNHAMLVLTCGKTLRVTVYLS